LKQTQETALTKINAYAVLAATSLQYATWYRQSKASKSDFYGLRPFAQTILKSAQVRQNHVFGRRCSYNEAGLTGTQRPARDLFSIASQAASEQAAFSLTDSDETSTQTIQSVRR
jgi:hypothetical protein